MKHKIVAPANARYRCGFPGCSKRYVSTDGVRKHARKMHNDWLRSVDVHSVLRDKSYESKPSTYCIMESGEGGETVDHGLFDPAPRAGIAPAPAPSVSANVTDEMMRHGGGGPMGNGGGFVPGFMPPEAMMFSAMNSRTGNPVLDALTMGRQLSLPQAMNLHALFKDNPVAREQWANIAAALLANPPAVEHEAPGPSTDAFTPMMAPAVPAYDTPIREGKTGGDISPFALDKSNPSSEHPPHAFARPVSERAPERPPAPEPPMLNSQQPSLNSQQSSFNSGMLSVAANPWSEAKAGLPSPSMLDTWSKPNTLERTADFDSDDAKSEAVDGEPADMLDLGDVDCDAFLQTLLCA